MDKRTEVEETKHPTQGRASGALKRRAAGSPNRKGEEYREGHANVEGEVWVCDEISPAEASRLARRKLRLREGRMGAAGAGRGKTDGEMRFAVQRT